MEYAVFVLSLVTDSGDSQKDMKCWHVGIYVSLLDLSNCCALSKTNISINYRRQSFVNDKRSSLAKGLLHQTQI